MTHSRFRPTIGFASIALLAVLAPSGWAADGTWNLITSGNWSVAANWTPVAVPGGAGSTVSLTSNLTGGGKTVTIDTVGGSQTVGNLNIGDLDGTTAFTLAASAGLNLIFDNGGSTSTLNQISTSFGDSIGAPILLNNSLNITNSGTKALSITSVSGITANSAGTKTITNLGSGTGGVSIAGVIGNGSGAVAVVQNSTTSLLTLAAANTFTGGLSILSGTVVVSNASGLGGSTNVVSLGNSSGAANSTLSSITSQTYTNSIVVASGNTGIATIGNIGGASSSPVFSGSLTLNNHDVNLVDSAVAGQLTFSGLVSGTGNVNITDGSTGNILVTGGLTSTGNVTLSSGGAVGGFGNIRVQTGSINNSGTITNVAGDNLISAVIGSNVANIVQTGTGSLTISGANTSYANGIFVQSGTLLGSTNASAFGTGTIKLGDTSGVLGAALLGAGATAANSIIVQAGNSGQTILGNNGSVSAVFSGLITLNKDLTVAPNGTGSVNMSGAATGAALTGTGNLLIASLAPTTTLVSLGGTNSGFTGNVIVTSGTLRMTSAGALSSANTVTVNSGSQATFNINGNDQAIAGLRDGVDGGGSVINTASAKTLTLAGSGTYAFSGVISGTGAAQSNFALTKSGAGTQTLSGNNTYTGATTVSAGTLLINGSSAGSAVTVSNANTTLGGSGTIAPGTSHSLSVGTGAIVAPGTNGTVGTLTVSLASTGDAASFATGAKFAFDLNAPGTSDTLAFTGIGSITDVTFHDNVIDFTNLGGLAAGNYTLFTFDAAGTYTGTLVLGTGLGSFAPSSSLVYTANSIVLNIAGVPEPGTVALTGVGFVGMLYMLRRRRQS